MVCPTDEMISTKCAYIKEGTVTSVTGGVWVLTYGRPSSDGAEVPSLSDVYLRHLIPYGTIQSCCKRDQRS